MAKGFMSAIRERVAASADGTIFVSSDFADLADSNTVRQCLFRLVKDGTLRRILRGIYEKPKYSSFLEEFVAADPDAVAKALARSYHWTIAPTGSTALNLLGLSTQVPAVWTFVSDGPYRTYVWERTKLTFKHRTNREVTGLSYGTALVVQALKTLRKSGVTPEVIRRLSDVEKRICLQEAREATDWVYDAIRKICGADGSPRRQLILPIRAAGVPAPCSAGLLQGPWKKFSKSLDRVFQSAL